MFNFNPLNSSDFSVDLTPLIDVLFLLLVFFILTMAVNLPSIEVSLSQTKTAQEKQDDVKKEIIFSIDNNGTLYFGEEKILKNDIEKYLKDYKKDSPIIFNVDKKAHFDEFILTIDEVKSLGFSNFHINALKRD